MLGFWCFAKMHDIPVLFGADTILNLLMGPSQEVISFGLNVNSVSFSLLGCTTVFSEKKLTMTNWKNSLRFIICFLSF
jgi:hypothetical protein